MGNEDLLTDDYVAELLAQEAKDCSLKYSSLGMEAYTSSSKSANKAKPNKRFLQHIIRETKNHNEALLAKEAAESQARLSDLAAAEEKRRRRTRPAVEDIRRRQLGDITAILRGRRKTQDGGEEKREGGRRRDREGRSRSRDRHGRRGTTRDGNERHARDGHHRSREDEASDNERRHGRRHRRRDRDDRSRSPRSETERHRRRRSPEERELYAAHRARRRDPLRLSRSPSRAPADGSEDTCHAAAGNDDSDPLEELIGPQPPPRVRGRGAARGPAAMDSRFSDTYDPAMDVQLEDEDDGENVAGGGGDWDEALEALRDRERWKRQGAERLRAAGFTEEQVRKWEAGGSSGGEKDINEVRWAKKGEGREWDRGKEGAPAW